MRIPQQLCLSNRALSPKLTAAQSPSGMAISLLWTKRSGPLFGRINPKAYPQQMGLGIRGPLQRKLVLPGFTQPSPTKCARSRRICQAHTPRPYRPTPTCQTCSVFTVRRAGKHMLRNEVPTFGSRTGSQRSSSLVIIPVMDHAFKVNSLLKPAPVCL